MNQYQIAIMNKASLEATAKRRPLTVYERMLLTQAELTIWRGRQAAERDYARKQLEIFQFNAARDGILWDDNPERREDSEISGADDARASAALNAREKARLVRERRRRKPVT